MHQAVKMEKVTLWLARCDRQRWVALQLEQGISQRHISSEGHLSGEPRCSPTKRCNGLLMAQMRDLADAINWIWCFCASGNRQHQHLQQASLMPVCPTCWNDLWNASSAFHHSHIQRGAARKCTASSGFSLKEYSEYTKVTSALVKLRP